MNQLELIQFLKCDILAYTPGISVAHPIPQVTRPTTVHLPDSAWQTSGDPPSPVQASLPVSVPAHTSLASSWKRSPTPAPLRFKALFSAELHSGPSISCTGVL